MSGNYKIALTTILVFIVFCSISHAEEQSLDEISRKLENPLTNLWALTFQENFRSEGPINLPSVSGDAGWFDFIAGGRVLWQATDRWSLMGRTDFGGFDFNFSSDFSWNGVSFVGFDATDWLQILLGFRVLYTDYSDGRGDNRFVFDTWMYGPVIGLKFHN